MFCQSPPGNPHAIGWRRAAWLLLALLGCSEAPPLAEVTGTVRCRGELVPSGTIAFVAADGRADSGTIQDGSYTLPRAPIGLVTIQVAGGSDGGPPRGKGMTAGMKATTLPALRQTEAVQPPPESTRRKGFRIALKYADVRTSGLTYEVQPGRQTHDIDLP